MCNGGSDIFHRYLFLWFRALPVCALVPFRHRTKTAPRGNTATGQNHLKFKTSICYCSTKYIRFHLSICQFYGVFGSAAHWDSDEWWGRVRGRGELEMIMFRIGTDGYPLTHRNKMVWRGKRTTTSWGFSKRVWVHRTSHNDIPNLAQVEMYMNGVCMRFEMNQALPTKRFWTAIMIP